MRRLACSKWSERGDRKSYILKIVEIFGSISLLHLCPSLVGRHLCGVPEHIGAKLLTSDGFVTLLTAESADIGRLVRALGRTVSFLFAVAAGSSEWTLDALVGAVGLVMAVIG